LPASAASKERACWPRDATTDDEARLREREAGWNANDAGRIMAGRSGDMAFRSRTAEELTGSGQVRGSAKLRADRAAPAPWDGRRGGLERACAGRASPAIVHADRAGVHAAVTLRFGPNGLFTEASARHATA
jgi:hypothetical protein